MRKERDGSRRYAGRAAETIEARRPQLEAYEDLCDEIGEDPGTVGLAWLLTRPAVTGPIVGPRTPEHLDSAVHAVDVTLDDKVLTPPRRDLPGPQDGARGLRLVATGRAPRRAALAACRSGARGQWPDRAGELGLGVLARRLGEAWS